MSGAEASKKIDHEAQPQALSGLRVLDFTGDSTQYCGKMFAQLGADVLLIEPSAGSRSRYEGPFLGNQPHKERSLGFAYFNQGKRGMCLDLHREEAQKIVRQLVSQVDLVIEAESPGSMQSYGLDFSSLQKENGGLIMTSITPFGQTGPYAQFQGGDMVALALGGLLNLGGYPGHAPIAAYGNQALLAAAQFAAVASMMAVWEAETRMENKVGQHIDVSVHESVVMALENSVQFVELEKTIRKRNGGEQRQAGTGVFPCKDGMVYLMAGGIASNRFWGATTQWLIDAGAPDAEQLRAECWNDQRYLATDDAKRIFSGIFLPFAVNQTKAELYAEGQRRRIPICPVSTTADLMINRQLAYRHFFQSTIHTFTNQPLTVPGAPYGLSATPWQLGRPAPMLGEHTSEVLTSLGYDMKAQEVCLRAGITA